MRSNIPTRNEKSIFAEIKLKYRSHDLFIFIEDEKMPVVYNKIIKRLYKNINIGKIYSLKSKENVLNKFDEWLNNNSQLEKCIFIVDKDFDSFKGKKIHQHKNLVELEYYTIENYLIGKEETLSLMQCKIFNLSGSQLERMLDWEKWISYVFTSFKRLFVSYVIANKYELTENCGISPYRYLVNGSDEIDEQQIINYIANLRTLCAIYPEIDYEDEVKSVEHFYRMENGEYDFHSLIKGKYIYAALLKHLNHISGKKFDEDMAALILADNLNLKKFDFLKKKIDKIFDEMDKMSNPTSA